MDVKQIKIEDYDYPLPDEKIAKYPLSERDSSKLLVYEDGKIVETVFNRITDFLPEKSLLIYNNTRVIRARLLFKKETGAQIEIFCLEPEFPADYVLNFQSYNRCEWKCLIGNQKRWKEGILRKTVNIDGTDVILTAELKNTSGTIVFNWDDSKYTFAEIIEAAGILPVPPYLKRMTETSDLQTYQTVYSKIKGSVAAPTAGLHFTPELLKKIDDEGFKRDEITLHVGAGTFKPVKAETMNGHEMHAEFFSVKRSTIENILEHSGKIVATGTTSVRTLESLYYIGCQLETNETEIIPVSQWQPYEMTFQIPAKKALKNILKYLDDKNLETLTSSTQIIIAPGYKFRIVDVLITNFHQPRSTLLLLVSAFVDGNWKNIYDYALNNDFRFLSYGDSSLLISAFHVEH